MIKPKLNSLLDLHRCFKRERSAPPLVVRVDAPDGALHEDLVLVHGDQKAERERRELLEEDRVRRPVAGEELRVNNVNYTNIMH